MIWRRWAGLVAALVLLPFAATDAKASCGDYVHLDGLSDAPLPVCSNRETPLPTAPLAPITTVIAETACFLLEPLRLDDAESLNTPERLLFTSRETADRLERPPRF